VRSVRVQPEAGRSESLGERQSQVRREPLFVLGPVGVKKQTWGGKTVKVHFIRDELRPGVLEKRCTFNSGKNKNPTREKDQTLNKLLNMRLWSPVLSGGRYL